MKYIRARLYLLFSLAILILAALASFGAQAQGQVEPVAPPTSLASRSITQTSITLIWTKSDGATFYRVRKDSADSFTDVGDVATYTFSGLTAGTQYTLEVRARNSDYQSASASISASTLPMTTGNGGDGGDGDSAETCAAAYSGSGGAGSISVSWAAHPPDALNPGSTIWYCVTSEYESKATDRTSAVFSGLDPGVEYSWHVDAFSCVGDESMAEGTCVRITTDSPHAFGQATTSGGSSSNSSGSGSSSGSSSDSSDSSGSSSSGSSSSGKRESSAPSAPPPEAYLDHSVTVGGNANFQPLTGSGIGNAQVIAQVVISATDVWGHVPAGTRVCFVGRIGGGVMFLDAATMPRALSWLPHSIHGNDTCAQLPGAGTVALVMGAGPYAAAAPASAAAEDPPQPEITPTQPICQIKLTRTLNLRSEPAIGQIIGLVWLNSEVPVYEAEWGWYLIEFEGQFGYIIGSHRKLLWGSC